VGDLNHFLIGSVLVTAGAIVGTPLRFYVSRVIGGWFGLTFPWGTLVVNVTGCFGMGLAAAYAAAHGLSGTSEYWLLVATGFLGSYTTVSSFALQTLALARDGENRGALGNIALSVGVCLAVVAAGYALGTPLFAGGAS
jgi:fluoride exporter